MPAPVPLSEAIALLKDPIRLSMKEQVLAKLQQLNLLKESEEVNVKFNGGVWPGIIRSVRKRAYAYPDFNIQFADKSRYWVSGLQIEMDEV